MTSWLERERHVRSGSDAGTDGRTSPARVLVVDPDSPTRSRIRMVLQQTGLQVLEADAAGAARAIVTAVTIDLAIIEMTLPDGSGDVLAAELAQRGTTPVLMSGMPAQISKARVSGYTLLRKPFTVKALTRAVVLGVPFRSP